MASWFVTVTPHAIRFAGGALRVFWSTKGGHVVVATAKTVLATAGTAAAAKVAAEVALVAIVIGGTVSLVRCSGGGQTPAPAPTP